MSFREQGIEAPAGFVGNGFLVRPLLPSDNELDYAAVMASREFLYHWEQEPPYPAEDFSLADNLADLEQMRSEHVAGTRYVYTVMASDETEVLGCTYFFPNDDRMWRTAEVTAGDASGFASVDLVVAFWARVDTWAGGFERTLLDGVWDWVRNGWSAETPVVMTNVALEHQVATIEAAGLTRRFSYDREKDMYTNLVFG